jgi:tRNA A-37 threonylcarbamoyl transferase component Bud32
MNITDFARIRNAKALLLTPDKRVLHFPATNKVRIDNMNPEREYPEAFVDAIRKEYNNADKAARATGLVPPVQNYRELGNMVSYTQNYAGTPLPKRFKGINSKEQYKLGSQVGRMQNRLLKEGLGHTDIHEGNIVKPDVNKRQVKLIDNDAIKNMNTKYDEAEMKNLYWKKSLGKPFMTGYNNRINFTQQKQMQHFANFALPLTGYGNVLKNSWVSGVKGGAASGASLGSNIGAIAGVAKGAGIGETEEEKANTTALGRTGKVLGGYLGGTAIGAGAGAVIGGGSRYVRGKLRPDPKQLTSSQPYNVQW